MKFTWQYGIVLALLSTICACNSTEKAGFEELAPREDLEGVVPFDRKLVIEESLELRPGSYLRPAQGDDGVIILEGVKDIEVDLTGVSLHGKPLGSDPDEGSGVGIMIRNCEGLRVRGGHLSGYRVAIRVENSDDIQIEGVEVDPVFGKRLIGTTTLPDSFDRLNIQMDDSEHWAEHYGAAILVVDSSRVVVRNCRARHGQNGLVALRSEGCRFVSNDFSFLSGWGIALAHCDKNLIASNRCDSVTRRGTGGRAEPDHGATGILITGGSSDNTIAANSARRCSAGGREIFGGQASGTGNRWFANDFSGAECVSVDLDRSRDTWFIGNRIHGSRGAGLRARGTEHLVAKGNHIELVHGSGICLDGGFDATLQGNEFLDCDLALEVIGDPGANGGLDLDHWIAGNRFAENIQDLVLDHGRGLAFWQNDFESAGARAHLDGLQTEGDAEVTPTESWGGLADEEGHLPSGRGVNSRLRVATGESPEVLGRVASWNPPKAHSRLPLPTVGSVDPIDGTTWLGDFGPWDPTSGTPRPKSHRARGIFAGATWDATWFTWTTESDPRGDLERWRSRRFEPLERRDVEVWCDPWGGQADLRESLPEEQFGLIATTEVYIDREGTYLLSEISDDGLRILIDDEVVLEDWSWHPERQRSRKIELTPGSHRVRVEYFQIDGTAVLSLELREPPSF